MAKQLFMYTNSLIHQTSPYLLQHAHNPVDWHAWSPDVLEMARTRHKMLLISIGYAACHWCHVMEKECFEDPQVAEIMNAHYICIKVDREERPDIDQIYMNASVLISGSGGWPLNAFALEDGKPYYAGTYFPNQRWKEVLLYFADLYQKEPEKLKLQAEHLAHGIAQIEIVGKNTDTGPQDPELPSRIFAGLDQRVDHNFGGLKGSIKFPMPTIWEFMLHYYKFSKDPKVLRNVTLTLDQMAMGGIYDQIAGGFARYATDPHWHVPHFEKMLYDNAQLISLYSHAFQITGNSLYKKIVFETVDFVKSELLSPEGGFYSSIDADSQGEEGRYYLWKAESLIELLGKDAEFYMDVFGITFKGNWEAGWNIPDRLEGKGNWVEKYGMRPDQIEEKIAQINHILKEARKDRIRPSTDDKILTSWNALMSNALMDASQAFSNPEFLQLAEKNLNFISKHLQKNDGGLCRSYRSGQAGINGFLDDYAFYIQSLLKAYQMSFDPLLLDQARELTDYVCAHFLDANSGMFFYTDDKSVDLIARKMELNDNVIPSSSSVMAKNLMGLDFLSGLDRYQDIYSQQFRNIVKALQESPGDYSSWAQLSLSLLENPYQLAVVGRDWKSKLQELQKNYLPQVWFLGSEAQSELILLKDKFVPGKTMLYVCRNKTCQLPVQEVGAALSQIE